jgi:serine/threonine protein kinase
VDAGAARIERFELIRLLGSGGMGTVFEARDRTTGARVAIKVLHERAGMALYQFKHEFRILSDISHPFLVQFGELFEDAGKFYLTMELVDGENFLDYVRPGFVGHLEESTPLDFHAGVLDVQRLRDALGKLVSALMVLHGFGIVHRDVKPQNVLVTGEGRLVLLDFGLAMSDEVRAQHPELAGTLAYMAPEQLKGVGISEASDWYAVGLVLFEALTGRLPHSGVPAWSTSARVEAVAREMLRETADLPEDLCELCLGLLKPDPEGRLNERAIARALGLVPDVERRRSSFRSQLQFSRDLFVARHKELGLLREALSRARTGGCTVVRITGESGVGKTSLLRRWVADLRNSQLATVILSSRCYERETLPYRGVDGVVDALSRHLGDMAYRREGAPTPRDAALLGMVFPVLREMAEFDGSPVSQLTRLDPQEARSLAFSALRELLAGLATKTPLVVHIDDAHWIDMESVKLLSSLTAGDSAPRMLLVFTERPSRLDPLTTLLASVRSLTSIDLGPLEADDSELLASQLLSRYGGGESMSPASVARKSGGNPMFIHELVLQEESTIGSGMSLETALSTRIDLLDAGRRRLLELLSLAPAPLRHEVARAAAGLDATAYPAAVSTLRFENFATFYALAESDEIQPYHDRIREFVTARMDDATRRERHLELAQAIESLVPEELDALAYHFLEGGVRDKAARYARGAAERALGKLAFEHAARSLEIALRAEDHPATRALLERQLGDALGNAGRGVEAAEAYLRAASYREVTDANELRRRAGEQLLRAGHVERGIRILSTILRELGLRIPRTDAETGPSVAAALVQLQVRIYRRGLRFSPRPPGEVTAEERLRLDACWTVATGLSVVHHLRATDFQARSLLLALEMGEPDRVLKSASLLAAALSMVEIGRPLARRLIAGARELAEHRPSAENRAWLALTSGAAAMGDWDFQRCIDWCERAESEFRQDCTGVAWEVVTSQAFALWSMVFEGQLRSAAERLPELVASARGRGDRHALATLILSPLHLVGLAADEPGRVRAETVATAGEWPEDFACFQHMCAAYVLAHVDLYEARAQEAWAHVLYAWRMLRRSHVSGVQFQRVDLLSLRARAALALATRGDRVDRKWLEHARRDRKRLERIKIAPAVAMAALVEGAALHAEGRGAEAAAHFQRARANFDLRGMALHSALAQLAGALATGDPRARADGELRLRGLGVVAPARMLRIWAPGFRS